MKTILHYLFLIIAIFILAAGPIWAGFYAWGNTDIDNFWGFIRFLINWGLWSTVTETVGAIILGISGLFKDNN